VMDACMLYCVCLFDAGRLDSVCLCWMRDCFGECVCDGCVNAVECVCVIDA
jgi:hypothetical protein